MFRPAWRSKDGKEHLIDEMDDAHLAYTIRMLERNGWEDLSPTLVFVQAFTDLKKEAKKRKLDLDRVIKLDLAARQWYLAEWETGGITVLGPDWATPRTKPSTPHVPPGANPLPDYYDLPPTERREIRRRVEALEAGTLQVTTFGDVAVMSQFDVERTVTHLRNACGCVVCTNLNRDA